MPRSAPTLENTRSGRGIPVKAQPVPGELEEVIVAAFCHPVDNEAPVKGRVELVVHLEVIVLTAKHLLPVNGQRGTEDTDDISGALDLVCRRDGNPDSPAEFRKPGDRPRAIPVHKLHV
ncbi:MAG: hypothetical protein BWY06_03471 [Candidatus Latescibacteria bacterium ADurb.Bin168]|nr:MAG: hypothetical protein BWY06_03471 [Candidatus Latescibacteria bacterium ADurb.Bin168]